MTTKPAKVTLAKNQANAVRSSLAEALGLDGAATYNQIRLEIAMLRDKAKDAVSAMEDEASKAIRWGTTLRILGDVLGVDYDDHDAVLNAFKARIGVKYIAGIDKIPADVYEGDVAHSLVQPLDQLAAERKRVGAKLRNIGNVPLDPCMQPAPLPNVRNYVGALLEYCVAHSIAPPQFLFGEAGLAHDKTFTCRAESDALNSGVMREGKTKKEAKNRAAEALLTALEASL